MWRLNLVTFIFSFLICESRSSMIYPVEIVEQMKWTLTPQEWGNYMENQLAKPESRLISRPCFRDLLSYVKGLGRLQIWAYQMFDASAKFPSGLFRGYAAGLGSYDQCLSIKSETLDIRGKYCLGRIRLYNFTYGLPSIPFYAELNAPRWIDLPEGTIYYPWGVCLPDSCSAKDFRLLHLLFFLGFSEDRCQSERNQSTDIDNGDIAALSILAVIVSFAICSTVYDMVTYYACEEYGSPILRSFSFFSNSLKILTIKENTNDIACIYGLRTLSMLLVMYGFTYLLLILSPLINWLDVVTWVLDKNKSSILEAIICADTFFVISGLLISYNYLKLKDNGIKFNILTYYLRKIIRLTPALGITILVHATLFRHIGSGPIWPNIRDSWLVNNCRESWWTSLLYIQNYAVGDMRDVCILQTMQLSMDMQLYLLSPLILLPLHKAPKFTISAVGFLIVCSVVSPFLTAWVYQLKAVIATSTSLMDLLNYMEYYYFPTHTRASPWLIGFLMGYFLYHSKKPGTRILIKKKLNVFIVLLLWLLSMAIIVFCIFIGRQMIHKAYDWVNHAFHMALVRPLWSVAISWIVFACVHGYGGPINWILSSPFFQVLSRIAYCTYLINISVMFIMTHQTTVGYEFTDFHALENYVKYVCISLIIGFVWTLLFESPIVSLMKVFCGQNNEEDIISVSKKSAKEVS